jgi:hypothetical protein
LSLSRNILDIQEKRREIEKEAKSIFVEEEMERIQGRSLVFIDIIKFQVFIIVQGGILEHFTRWATMMEKKKSMQCTRQN